MARPSPRPGSISVRGGVHTLTPFPRAAPAAPLTRVVPASDGGTRVLDAALKSTRLGRAFAAGRLTAAQSDRLGRLIAARGKAAARLATQDLVQGKTTLRAWQARLKAETVAAASAAARAKLGTRNLAAADRRALEDALHKQLGYLDRFAAGLKAGTIPRDARAVARAGLYGAAAWSTAESVAADRAGREGMDQEISILGIADHCSSCVEEAARGWVAIGSLVPIGERDCMANCRCHVDYRKAPAAQAVARRKTVAKPEPRPQPRPQPQPQPQPRPTVDQERAGLQAEVDRTKAEYDRLKAQGNTITPERIAARNAYFGAQSRLQALDSGTAGPTPTATAATAAAVTPAPAPIPLRRTEEDLRAAISTVRRLSEKVRAAEDWVAANREGTAAPIRTQGMARAELMDRIVWRGIPIHFPDTPEGRKAAAFTLADWAGEARPIPDRVFSATKSVILSEQKSSFDAAFARRFGEADFTSGATAGRGEVVAHGGLSLTADRLVHESGHNLAWELYGSSTPGKDYARAMATGEPAPTAYGAKSPAEDFAEAVREHWRAPQGLRATSPNRYQVIDRLIKDPSYGG